MIKIIPQPANHFGPTLVSCISPKQAAINGPDMISTGKAVEYIRKSPQICWQRDGGGSRCLANHCGVLTQGFKGLPQILTSFSIIRGHEGRSTPKKFGSSIAYRSRKEKSHGRSLWRTMGCRYKRVKGFGITSVSMIAFERFGNDTSVAEKIYTW